MTLDEVIKYEEEIVEENQRVVDTGIIYDDVTIDMLYCDDTEVIEEHLANYQRCVEAHRQLAEWLKELKRLKEQELKRGQWIMHFDYSYPEESEQECSVCLGLQPISIADDDYCPRCGVKMEV